MSTIKRRGNKWSINEILSLQREYELLEWTIQKIAQKHERTNEAILYKLESEGFISSWNDARGFNSNNYQKNNIISNKNSIKYDCESEEDEQVNDNSDDDEDYIEESEIDEEEEEDEDEDEDNEDEVFNNLKNNKLNKLTDRVWKLETSLNDINIMVKQIFDNLVEIKNNKKSNLYV